MAGIKNTLGALRSIFMGSWGMYRDAGTYDLASPIEFSTEGSVSLSELNAGKVVLAPLPGSRFRVVGFFLRFVGTFASATDIRVSTTNATPVDIATVAIANATDGAVVSEVTNNRALGTFPLLTDNNIGIQIRKTGSNATGGTRIDYVIRYRIAE